MLPTSRRLCTLVSVAVAGLLTAQSWTPKSIRFEGAAREEQPQLLTLTGLHPATPLTKEQIEVALQKLADTGSYTDVSYTVSNDALVIHLASSDNVGELPVRFTNFVWWQPADLEHLVETEVPLYHGELSLTGSLTTQVEATLVKLARLKGLDVKVTGMRENKTLALSIEQPSILVGDLKIDDAQPRFGPTMAQFRAGLRGQELDVVTTSRTVQQDATEIFRNAGYLDAVVDAPMLGTPQTAAHGGYSVDITAVAHPGELYRVKELAIAPEAPLTDPDLRAAAELKPGENAAPMGMLISSQQMARLYAARGYQDAEVHGSTSIDNVAHLVTYSFAANAGSLFHLAAVDASGVPADLQGALMADRRLAPGVVADNTVMQAIQEDARALYPGRAITVNQQRDRAAHTVAYAVHFGSTAPRR